MPLLKNYILPSKHPWPFFKNCMHLCLCVESKDHKSIGRCHYTLKATFTPYPRGNGIHCMIWHLESWEESYHASCPLFCVLHQHLLRDLEAVPHWLSWKRIQSETSTGIRNSYSICPRRLGCSLGVMVLWVQQSWWGLR